MEEEALPAWLYLSLSVGMSGRKSTGSWCLHLDSETRVRICQWLIREVPSGACQREVKYTVWLGVFYGPTRWSGHHDIQGMMTLERAESEGTRWWAQGGRVGLVTAAAAAAWTGGGHLLMPRVRISCAAVGHLYLFGRDGVGQTLYLFIPQVPPYIKITKTH